MIRLAVFDIDGTLISPQMNTIASETVDAIRNLRHRNIIIAVATGRQWHSIPPEIKGMDFDYYILSNGAYITDGEGTILHQHEIDAETVEALVNDFLERDYPLELRYITGNQSVNPKRSIIDYTASFFSKEQIKKGLKASIVQQKLNHAGELPISCVGHIETEDKPYFDRKYPQLHFMMIFEGRLCDINKVGVSKATGVAEICSYLNIDIQDTIAFGDDENDIELIRDAGIGVAMGNAIPAVLNVADYVTDCCEDLGVANALKYFALLC